MNSESSHESGVSDVVEIDDVLGKLHMLKDNGKYKKVNITEDLTKDERNIVNSWLNLAKQKNDKKTSKFQFFLEIARKNKGGIFFWENPVNIIV